MPSRNLTILSQIGQGALAEIYGARDEGTGENLAVKILRSKWAADPAKQQRFAHEANTGKVFDHPHVVKYHDTRQISGNKAIVMELVNGITLDTVLRFHRHERTSCFVGVVRQLGQGLSHIHSKGYIHRDVNPHNIMLTTKNDVKVIDLGLCIRLKDTARMQWQRCGTPGFMAPEQVRFTKTLTARADIYAMAAVIYLLVSGQEPFPVQTPHNKMTSQINRDPCPPSFHNSTIPKSLDEIILRGMSRQPSERPTNPEYLADAICRQFNTPGFVFP